MVSEQIALTIVLKWILKMSAFQPSSAATSDRLVNKVAMCGALFAGVAFIGYRIVRNAVKKSRNKSDQGNYIHNKLLY